MSHDFAKKKKKKPKARRKVKKVGASTWLLTGIASGLFIAFVTYLVMLAPAAHQQAGEPALAQVSAGSSKKSTQPGY